VYAYGMSMGDGSLKRNEIQYKLCGSYMRVQNAATGAVTEFTTGLTVQEVEIAADVIWTNCFLERHKKSVVLSAQRNYDRLFKNAGFNWKTFKAVDSVNPVLWVIDYLSDCEEKDRDLLSKKLPHHEHLGDYAIYGGLENVLYAEYDRVSFSCGMVDSLAPNIPGMYRDRRYGCN
jgi:hypothetical protein